MTSKLKIDFSYKTERLRFSGTPPLNYLTAMHNNLSFQAENAQVWSRHVILYESKLELSKLVKYELYTRRNIWENLSH